MLSFKDYCKLNEEIKGWKHAGVMTKSTNESAELDEATFVSDSPSTNASRGVNFEVKKNGLTTGHN